MVNKWKIEALNSKVENEVFILPKDLQADLVHVIELLEEFGPFEIGMPHVKPISNKIWEIRLKGKSGIARALYTLSSNKTLVMLHVFLKKTQKTPKRNLELALKKLKEVKI